MQTIFDEHISDYDDLLPHVFVGDLTRHIGKLAVEPEGVETAAKIIQLLEGGIREGSAEVQELIGVSFVENVPKLEQVEVERTRSLFGPNLIAEDRRIN